MVAERGPPLDPIFCFPCVSTLGSSSWKNRWKIDKRQLHVEGRPLGPRVPLKFGEAWGSLGEHHCRLVIYRILKSGTGKVDVKGHYALKRVHSFPLDIWIDRWIDGWMDGWTDGRTDGRTDRQIDR